MKVLIVGNYNPGHFSPFVVEQAKALQALGVEIDYYGVVGKGALGYFKNRTGLIRKIKEVKPDIVHAHYGLSGLLANLQRRVPTVVTYHGSDVHSGGMVMRLSKMAMRLARYNIFVTRNLQELAGYRKANGIVIPCGIDGDLFTPGDKAEARQRLGWDAGGKYIVFAGAFTNAVKNSELAKQTAELVDGAHLIEMREWTRQQVVDVMRAADCLLMTSHREGSPQVIKEAMSVNLPIVTVNVGDVADVIGDTQGCHIVGQRSPEALAEAIAKVFERNQRTQGRQRILDLQLTNPQVAHRVLDVYNKVLGEKQNK